MARAKERAKAKAVVKAREKRTTSLMNNRTVNNTWILESWTQ